MNSVGTDWSKAPLSEVTSLIKDGSHGSHFDVDGGIPFLSAKDVRDGKLFIPSDCRRISQFDFSLIHKNYQIKPADILLTIVGTIGRACLVSETDPQFSVQRSVAILRPNRVDAEYLYHFVRSYDFQKNMRDFINASAQGGVYLSSLAKCVVGYPIAKAEQTKIAEILSALDRAVEQTEAVIAKQQRIKTGLMQDLLTKGIDEHGNIRSEAIYEFKDSPMGRIPVEWNCEMLQDVLELIIDYRGRTPKKIGMEWGDGEIPALSANNVEMGKINFSKDTYYGSNALYRRWMTGGIVLKGDVVMTTEAPLGNVAQIPDRRQYILSQRVILLRGKRNILVNDFLADYLTWERFQNAMAVQSSGTTATGIQRKKFEKLFIALPKPKEQEIISQRINGLTENVNSESATLSKLQSLKIGLMQNLLTGKVRVTELLKRQASR
jgi:type I restriction enzyme, S subunit